MLDWQTATWIQYAETTTLDYDKLVQYSTNAIIPAIKLLFDIDME